MHILSLTGKIYGDKIKNYKRKDVTVWTLVAVAVCRTEVAGVCGGADLGTGVETYQKEETR